MSEILPASILQEKAKKRDRSCLWRFRGQKQKHVNKNYSVGKSELMN